DHGGEGLPEPHQIFPLCLQHLLLRPGQPHILLRSVDPRGQEQLCLLPGHVLYTAESVVLCPGHLWDLHGHPVFPRLPCALKEIRCLLGLYFGLLLLLFTAQITIGVLIYTQHGSLERKVKLIVLDVIENYHKYPDAYSTAENWDFVQFQLRCCGWDSPQDWWLASSLRPNGSAPSGGERAFTSSPTTRSSSLMSPNSSLMSPSSQTLGPVPRVPCSCQNTSVIMGAPPSPAEVSKVSQPAPGPGAKASRVLPGPGVPGTATRLHSGELCSLPADSSVYQEGCSRSLYTWLHNNLISIVGISLGLGLLELGVMSLSMFLCRNLDHVYNKLSRYS
uniref:Tetraspanin n=1 Tax=Monodelphis domestica TaxID=13616 RepID=F6X6L0_MONDO